MMTDVSGLTAETELSPEDVGIGRLFDMVTDAIVVGDARTGRIVLWNCAAERLFGYTRTQALGMPLHALVPADLRDDHMRGLERFTRAGTLGNEMRTQTVELPAVTSDGSQRWVELSLTPIDNVASFDRLVLALVRDVTERRRNQDQLSAANDAVRQFVALAAHDLRSPLTAIRGAVDLLRRTDAGASVRMELLDLLDRQSAALTSMVAALLELSTIDAGGDAPRPRAVVVADLISDCVAGLGADVMVRITPGDLVVFADPEHLRRILTNLLTNAVRHGDPPVELEAEPVGDGVRLRIRDAGSGLDVQVADRAFDRFIRGPRSAGTGLGLAIVKGLTEANGGTVHYEDSTPHGACFVVELPGIRTGTGAHWPSLAGH
jgi:PAS domain S-box-containing protein